MVVAFVGDVEPQASVVANFLKSKVPTAWIRAETVEMAFVADGMRPELMVVAGYRRLIPPAILAIPVHGAVGFHSAKLPEYPGRAPVPWTLLRGDAYAYNTMFYLDEGVDTGDIIDQREILIWPGDTPDMLYRTMADTCVAMLEKHLPALLDGTAPRTPQDMSKRGPLTTKDGWDRWFERERLATGHA